MAASHRDVAIYGRTKNARPGGNTAVKPEDRPAWSRALLVQQGPRNSGAVLPAHLVEGDSTCITLPFMLGNCTRNQCTRVIANIVGWWPRRRMRPAVNQGDPSVTDVTVPGPSSPGRPDMDDMDDEFMAGLLIRMWALASGRTLRSDVRPEQLSSEELIRFWADDLTRPSGRHAGTASCMTRTAR
jgi:hypothetical protein